MKKIVPALTIFAALHVTPAASEPDDGCPHLVEGV